ncbi:MAG: hypothetical protein GY697_17315 [Desulfobacterales bacterium]|nr:hypothetical protein [Desulfobacterales bacterium]
MKWLNRFKARRSVWTAAPFSTEAIMYKEDIVFFDQLGFGWALDKRIILKVFSRAEERKKESDKVLFNRVYQTK